jgi:phosphoribosylanthranilate isomerase
MSAERRPGADVRAPGLRASGAQRRTLIKVCGLTRLEDARWALECGADWLGFIVHADGPRQIEPERAAAIVDELGGSPKAPRFQAVAVVAGAGPDEALAIARRAHAHRLQLHRADPALWPEAFPLPCAFAVGVTTEGVLLAGEPPARHLLMLDTSIAGQEGGTGRTWPWAVARSIAERRDVLLAGGLHAENVAEAIHTLRPFGVDAASRLESRPGVKDPEKVRRYVEAVRLCETTSTP